MITTWIAEKIRRSILTIPRSTKTPRKGGDQQNNCSGFGPIGARISGNGRLQPTLGPTMSAEIEAIPSASRTAPVKATKVGRRETFTPRPLKMRAKVSNVTKGAMWNNVDARSAVSRRVYDICAAIVGDLGGADRLSETKLSLVRRFASLAVLAEAQEAKLANGEEVNVMELAHLSSALVRLATRIGLKRVPREVIPTLHEYLETKPEIDQ
jgi:hypothetical protein